MWRSTFVATLFAIHPLHVKSVAWVAERKDVLSGVFFMLTLGAYAHYVRRRTTTRYLAVVILFACGLMSKTTLVTLPLVLFLLDYWPLRRFTNQIATGNSNKAGSWWKRQSISTRLILEEVPLSHWPPDSATGSGTATITVSLTASSGPQKVVVKLNAVNDGAGNAGDISWPVDILIADTTVDGAVNSADIS
jgi:hypothetical protein